jgi:alpha-1,3-mannosyltransferase
MKKLENVVPWLLAFEVAASVAIVYRVGYTEIDWVAYMQEVEGFLGGERDYRKLKGDTGPLVYPAGFVYLYAFLRWVTDGGQNIFRAQLIFAAFYVTTTATVFKIYSLVKAPTRVFVVLVLSKRIHSIFMLRMFNDAVAIELLYVSVLLFVANRWGMGCLVYSLAVSVKMNIFLFAPGLLFVLLSRHGLLTTMRLLCICAAVQVLLGAPFLLHDWESYMAKAFELSRVFTYKWTVNFKFLSEETFQSPQLGVGLLVATLVSWVIMWRLRWSKRDLNHPAPLVATLFESNMIGIIFSRTMHYQFYVWFFHQLPFLLAFSCKALPGLLKLPLLIAVEVAFNVYPSTWWSSLLLMTAMAAVLFGLLVSSDDEPRKKNRKLQ